MREEYGGLLHSEIPVGSKTSLKIADIGTGSWSEPALPPSLLIAVFTCTNSAPLLQYLAHRAQSQTPGLGFDRRYRFVIDAMSTKRMAAEEY